MGTQLPPPLSKRGRTAPTQFLGHVYCGQTAAWMKMKLGTEAGLGPGHIVLDGDPASPCPCPEHPIFPQFSIHVYCGLTAGWIKTALGMEVGLSPGHIVVHEDPAPSPKKGGGAPPKFSAHFYCGQTVGCIKMPFGMEVNMHDAFCSSYERRSVCEM